MDIMERLSLKNKTAMVTGGVRGIGKSIAAAIAQAGADVAIVDMDYAAAEATANALTSMKYLLIGFYAFFAQSPKNKCHYIFVRCMISS